MILGVGTDLCDIRRIQRSLERFGGRFTHRVYTENERTSAERKVTPAARYAMFYAAKEACAKALGTGFRQGVFWRDLEVRHRASGQPYMVLTGGALTRLQFLTPAGLESKVHVSLTDEHPLAHALVVIEATAPANAP